MFLTCVAPFTLNEESLPFPHEIFCSLCAYVMEKEVDPIGALICGFVVFICYE